MMIIIINMITRKRIEVIYGLGSLLFKGDEGLNIVLLIDIFTYIDMRNILKE